MPTEEELEQLVTEHIDKEKAVENGENVSGFRKGKGKGSDDRLYHSGNKGIQEFGRLSGGIDR